MNRAINWLQKYLIWAFPFVIISMIWSGQYKEAPDYSSSSLPVRMAWEVFSWNLMLWFACLVIFLFVLLFRTASGDQLLKRLANLKERDEREALITGIAAKSSFISTLALLIFLIGIAVLQVEVRTLKPDEIRADGHTRTISIGAHFNLFEKSETAPPPVADPDTIIKHDVPFTKLGLLMLVLFWQIGSFFLKSRRELKE